MQATMTRVSAQSSKYGGMFYYAYFRDDQGQSYKSCLYKECKNYSRWVPVIQHVINGKTVVLDGLKIKDKTLINADSKFNVVKVEEQENFNGN
jgi:predicted RNase H-related nuclease YkuK (DUF458 family)